MAKFVYDKRLTDKTSLSIISCGRVKYLDLTIQDEKVSTVKVNMGAPVLKAADIPVISLKGDEQESVIGEEIEVDGQIYQMTCVSMGNPHAVVFVDEVSSLPLEKIGPLFENHERFPKRVNTEFVKVLDDEHVEMRVWERGTGETMACGTGACAVTVACILNGLTKEEITVKLSGGNLQVYWDRKENLVYMTGSADTVFEGEIEAE